MDGKIDFILGLVPEKKREEARAALDGIVSSASVGPMELEIPESEIEKRYPVTEAIEIVKCRKEILLHASNYYMVVRPGASNSFAGGSLYQALKWYCESLDSAGEKSEEERGVNESYRAMMVMLLTLPLELFGDVQYSTDVALACIKEKSKYYKRLFETARARGAAPETEADAIANADFADAIGRAGAIIDAVEKMSGNGDER